MTAAAVLLSGAATAAAVSPTVRNTPVSGAEIASAIETSDRIAVSPLARFERSGDRRDAQRALAAAIEARDRLENVRGPEATEIARLEELIFLNHLVPGFSTYLAGPKKPDARTALDSVVRRGRAHRERARKALSAGRR